MELFLYGDFHIKGGLLDATYQAVKVYFHWGATDSKGSEHRVKGQHYAAEVRVYMPSIMIIQSNNGIDGYGKIINVHYI